MAAIRGKDSAPELTVRRALHRAGLRYRLHARHLPGTPDVVMPKYRLAIFVHGCFWHRHAHCKLAATPSSRRAFWLKKFRANARRDKRARALLAEQGWRVIVVWECATRGMQWHTKLEKKLIAAIKGSRRSMGLAVHRIYSEIPRTIPGHRSK